MVSQVKVLAIIDRDPQPRDVRDLELHVARLVLAGDRGLEQRFAVGLDADTIIDGFSYSGKLPKDTRLYERFLRAGIAMQLARFRSDPTKLEGFWEEMEFDEQLPTLEDGRTDVDAALRYAELGVLKKIQEEAGSNLATQMEQASPTW
jgi:hypothetical protein